MVSMTLPLNQPLSRLLEVIVPVDWLPRTLGLFACKRSNRSTICFWDAPTFIDFGTRFRLSWADQISLPLRMPLSPSGGRQRLDPGTRSWLQRLNQSCCRSSVIFGSRGTLEPSKENFILVPRCLTTLFLRSNRGK
jgi:hypothetical protein